MSETDLSLVGTVEMVDELARRFDAMVFIAWAERSKMDDTEVRNFVGGPVLCQALLTRAAVMIANGTPAWTWGSRKLNQTEEDGE